MPLSDEETKWLDGLILKPGSLEKLRLCRRLRALDEECRKLRATLQLAEEWLDEVTNPSNEDMRTTEGMLVDRQIRAVLGYPIPDIEQALEAPDAE